MADNDWYEKHHKDVAAALKKGRGAPKDQAVSCTLVRMKDGAYLICAHVSAGKAAAMTKEAKGAGGKVISAGVLFAGPDGPTFEVADGDLAVKAKFAAAAAEVLGSPLSVTVIGVAEPAPAGAAPADGAAAAEVAAVRAAVAKLVPAVQAAAKAHPERKADLLTPLARCQQHIKENQAAEAKAALGDVARVLRELAPRADGPAAQAAPAAPADKDEYEELYKGLLETVPGDLQRLRQGNPAAADKVQKVVEGAAAHAKKGAFKEAFDYLNRAAEAIAKAAGSGRVKEAVDVIPEGKVEAMKAALTQAQNKWDAAMTAARARMKPVQAALQADFPAAAKGVVNIVNSYEEELLAELRAGQAKADGDGLAAAVRGTLAKVHSLRSEALGDNVFSYLEECGVPVQAAFAEAFDEVEDLLQV